MIGVIVGYILLRLSGVMDPMSGWEQVALVLAFIAFRSDD